MHTVLVLDAVDLVKSIQARDLLSADEPPSRSVERKKEERREFAPGLDEHRNLISSIAPRGKACRNAAMNA
ncbi:hypothetical protein DACRYDRAFT_24731 [Dacryopinax primogenitus]|uniref:Uncharacterized protein n=1 Tax=Dacryopinax primogenitus (strain DJM 731) TaxID=1858805 RepID=M5FSR3_DACPD|nr:uncharacterized protein DACRYDRAFT_24731 [Dacryopinax primogenitus]EJT98279.1 hypothetical protein DACRYDRAFT_24731 [Dacryopinax primogenitus]